MTYFNEWDPKPDDPHTPLFWMLLFIILILFLVLVPLGAHADEATGSGEHGDYDVMELTCALGVSHKDCDPHYGAVDVAKIGEASLPIECQRWGLLSAPSSPNAADGNAYYHKIMCVRR